MEDLKIIIVKLGGSVITDKVKGVGIFRKNIVSRIAEEVGAITRKKKFNLIIVHGAGSFGHPSAKKYGLDKGYLSKKSLMGFAITKKLVMELSLLVSQEFIKKGLHVSIVQPSAIVSASGGRIKTFKVAYINGLLKKNVIPILFGDVMLDDTKGFSIISGDVMAAYLAKKLQAERLIFVTDVNGVFDKNPKIYGDAKLIKVLDRNNFEKIVTTQTDKKIDVTGEMRGKLLSVDRGLKNVEIAVVNGMVSSVVGNALIGKIKGTRFIF